MEPSEMPRILGARPGMRLEQGVAYQIPSDVRWVVVDGVFREAEDTDAPERLAELEAENERLKREVEELRRAQSRFATIGSLASGIANEINNPLNSILLTSQYALRHSGPLDLELAMGTIVKEARQAARIVKDVIRLAREDRSEKVPGDANALVTGAATRARRQLPTRRANLHLDLAEGLPPVTMNVAELENVLLELFQNAVEAMDGEVDIHLRTSVDERQVRIEVRDTGPGLHPDIEPSIFSPFFTTRRHRGATGLGLTYCHGIVSEHGGTLEAESRRSEGAVFTIRLPVIPPMAG